MFRENNFNKTELGFELASSGWYETSMSEYYNGSITNTFEDFTLLLRVRNFDDFLRDFSKSRVIQLDSSHIWVGIDTVYQDYDFGRNILCWQFSVVWDYKLYELCFIRNNVEELNIDDVLVWIANMFGLKEAKFSIIGSNKFKRCLDEVIDIPKINIPEEIKGNMSDFLKNDLVGFLEYVSTCSMMTLIYALGFNR